MQVGCFWLTIPSTRPEEFREAATKEDSIIQQITMDFFQAHKLAPSVRSSTWVFSIIQMQRQPSAPRTVDISCNWLSDTWVRHLAGLGGVLHQFFP